MKVKEAIEKSIGKGLDETQLHLISNLATYKMFLGGDTIVRKFDRNSDILLVMSGTVRVFSMSDEMVAELLPGSIIGEMSLVDDQPRSASARSVGETSMAVIPSKDLRQLMDDNVEIKATIMTNIARTLASRLRVAMIHMDGLSNSQD